MRTTVFVMVFILLSAASGQWLESTILLPDSLGGLTGPGAVVYHSAENRVYVAGRGGVLAIDCATNTKVGRIPIDPDVGILCLNTTESKLYCSKRDSVVIVDCASDSLIATLWVNHSVRWLCLNPVLNKLYVSTTSGYLTVIDCAGDSILRRCSLTSVGTMCFNRDENKLYCSRLDTLFVLDGDADTILHRFRPGPISISDLCLNPIENKLYCLYPGDIGPPVETTVTVVDCEFDSVLGRVRVAPGPSSMCYNSRANKLYVSCAYWFNQDVCIIDGKTDSLLATLAWVSSPFCFDSVDNAVYCLAGESLAIIDGSGDSIAAYVRTGVRTTALCHNPQDNTVFSTHDRTDEVLATDCATNTVCARLPTGCWPGELLYVPGPGKVYCAEYGSEYGRGETVVVIDAATNTVTGMVDVGSKPLALCANPPGTKVYCANEASGTVSIIDSWADSLVATVPVGSLPCALCYNTIDDKVYCAGTGEYPQFDTVVTIIDGPTDSVIAEPKVGRHPCALAYASSVNRIYIACLLDSSVTVLDGAGDSVLARVFTGTNPYDICYASDVNKVYVGHGVSEFVSVVDCRFDSVVATVPTPRGSGGMCHNPVNNCVYDWAGLSSELSVIDATSDTLVARLNIGLGRGRLLCDTVLNKVYLVGTGEVCVIDGATNSIIATIPIPSWGRGVAWNPTLGRVYVSNYSSSSLSVIADSATGIEEGRVPYAARGTPYPTVIRGVLYVLASSGMHGASSVLLDVSGRKVMNLRSGANDVRALAPGVYFVKGQDSGGQGLQGSSVRKVIVTE